MDTSTDHGRHLQKEGVPPSAYQTGPGVTSQVEGFLPQAQPPQLLTKKRLEDVLHEIEPNQLLDEDVTEVADSLPSPACDHFWVIVQVFISFRCFFKWRMILLKVLLHRLVIWQSTANQAH